MDGAHKSALAPREEVPFSEGLVLAALLHFVVFGAAFVLPRLFDRPPPTRKPIIAHLVALGKPRDPRLLPRKESPPPAAIASAAPVPGKAPPRTSVPEKHAPSRQELMEKALARAAGRATPESREEPDPDRAGSETGSPEGTAQTAEEGDAYFTAVHDAVLQNYVVPSVISERERMYLNASVLAWIGPDGRILKHEFQKRSGNSVFDQALELAIQRTRLPAPPPDLARALRDNGVVLNFKP